jgi:hypothetical protein
MLFSIPNFRYIYTSFYINFVKIVERLDMGRGFRVLLIGFLVFSLGFGTLYSVALGNIYTASNGFSMLAYLGNGWGAASALQNKATADFQPQEGIQTSWNLIYLNNGFTITEYSEESALMMTVNQAFKEWLIKKGNLVKAVIYKDNPEMGEQLITQFLKDRPEYKKYIEWYTNMLQQRHYEDFMKEKDSYDPKMVIENGELTREWTVNMTIEGREFIVFCKQYELELYGEKQVTVKSEYYSSEGIMVTDPYVGVWVYPYYALLGWWLVMYGEDDYVYVWYTYPEPNEADQMYAYLNLILAERTYSSIIPALFTAAGIVHFVAGLVSTMLGLAGPAMSNAENAQLGEAATIAWLNRANNNWGIRVVTYIHYIYPWTLYYGFLSSYFSIDFVLNTGQWVDALPNSQTTLLWLITIWGIGLGYVINGMQIDSVSRQARNYGYGHGFGVWVWEGPYEPPA